MKKLIAKTQEGTEYVHSKNDAFFVSRNAQKIVNILNENKYKLSESEKWYVYSYDFSQEIYTTQRIFLTNKGQLKVAEI